MANPDIQITLRGGERQGALLRYDPAHPIAGTVQLTSAGAIDCRGAYVRLQWRTEGRGDRDEAKIAEITLAQGALAANTSLRRDFEFTLPREPWSHAGKYVSIVWEIVAGVDLPLAMDVVERMPFLLVPRR